MECSAADLRQQTDAWQARQPSGRSLSGRPERRQKPHVEKTSYRAPRQHRGSLLAGQRVAVNLKQARLWVKRSKNSLDTEQAVEGDELRTIKRYLATREDRLPWLFVSERGQPMTRQAVNYLIGGAGDRAGLGRVWPHMLRAGYALSNKGHDFWLLQDFMGHRDPRYTSRYTRTVSRPFEGLWK